MRDTFPNFQLIQVKKLIICSLLALLLPQEASQAAAKQSVLGSPQFQYDITSFQSDLNLPLIVKSKSISIPNKTVLERLEKYQKDDRIEPIQITVEGREDTIIELSAKIAAKNQKINLANYLKNNFSRGDEIPGSELRLVTLDKEAFQFLDRNVFDSLFRKTHQEIFISSRTLKKRRKMQASLISQLSPFLDKIEINQISNKISKSENLSLDRDLLPRSAKNRVANHSVFRGPNCFHAALSFQSETLAASDKINIRQEPGYHREMINYDELWRILQLSFYEINPTQTPVQYGDMIVFFETKTPQFGPIDFKTLRHAATYLFGGYVYSKGSKSANSPYLVRTLAEEWNTWTKYTEKLGVKVFRRNLKHVKSPGPADRMDWVY
jgi:hypothetical protein